MSYALDNPRFFTILPNDTLYELLFELMQTSNNKGETSEESWIRVKTKNKSLKCKNTNLRLHERFIYEVWYSGDCQVLWAS